MIQSRVLLLLCLLAAVVVSESGCRGSEEGHVVRVATYPWPEGPGLVVATRVPWESVTNPHLSLSGIEDAIPERLPRNPAQPCNFGAKVEITFDDGRTLEYGPCRRPASIEHLRLALIAAWRNTRWLAPGEKHATRMVTVPLVTQTDVIDAYDLLRAAGLRVAIRNAFSAASLCVPIAQKQSPRRGTRAGVGSVVTFSAGWCPIGSPGVAKPMPTATVPSFDGKPATDVLDWADRSGMFWAIRSLPPLPESDAPHLLDNYRVVRQRPTPGAILRPGVIVSVGGRRGFRPTPITVWVEPR